MYLGYSFSFYFYYTKFLKKLLLVDEERPKLNTQTTLHERSKLSNLLI